MQGLIRLLSTCASGSAIGAKTLLHLGISGILKEILSGSGLVSTMSVSPALSRPPEQVYNVSLYSCLEGFKLWVLHSRGHLVESFYFYFLLFYLFIFL